LFTLLPYLVQLPREVDSDPASNARSASAQAAAAESVGRRTGADDVAERDLHTQCVIIRDKSVFGRNVGKTVEQLCSPCEKT